MAKIRKIKEKELIGGTSNTEVYPITHTKAVYDSKNRTLESNLEYLNSEVVWGEYSNINTYTTAGIYNITGERRNLNDGLPILNSSPGHTINARLEVFDSSIPDSSKDTDKCITQKLTLSNRVAGDGNVYIRTGRGRTYDSITWETWGKLQQNIEVGSVTTLDNLIDNGIYSGVYKYGSGIYDYETFVLVVINDYAIAGDNKKISQFKYAVALDGTVSYKSRLYSIKPGEEKARWDINWLDINEGNINKAINTEVTRAEQAEQTINKKLDEEIKRSVAADQDLLRNIDEEARRATEAEDAIKSRAIDADSLNVAQEIDEVKIDFDTLDDGAHSGEITIPAATTKSAGVMSAADKKKIDELNLQINGGGTYLVEPDVVKDKCYVNETSKIWFDLSSVTGSWNFATAIYPIDKGEEYNITCGSIRNIGVWFLSTNSPISNSTTAVIADSNIPSNAQLSNYPIKASDYPYLAITYNYGYEPKVEKVNRDCIVNEISIIKDSITDIASSLSIEEENEILSYEIKNYGLFVKTIFEDTIITDSGNRELSTGNATTNIIPLDWNYGIMINCAGYCYVAFYDENKNFIERKTSYCNIAEIPVSDFPANAKYVAFSYKTSGLGIDKKTPDVFATQVKKYSFDNCGVFRSTIKKKRNTRPRIDIYTTDSEYVILSKLMDAFLTEDCDVYFEFGNYNFEGIYKDMYDVYGLGSSSAGKELPLGGNCRYYLNNSTITGTCPTGVTSSNGCKVFGNLNEPCGFELYDGTIIANNCGYCIHSESLGAVGFYKHYIKNVKFVQNGGSRPLGCGAGNSTIVEVDSCSFISNTGFHDIAMHGIASTTYNRPAHTEVIVRNCSIPNGVKCNTLSANETGVLIYIGNESNVRPELTNGWELQELDAIEKGRQLALRALFVAAGAEYNETDQIIQKTAPWGTEEKWVKNADGTYTYWEEPAIVEHLPKHYYLNGLGDITEEQMIEIYNHKDDIDILLNSNRGTGVQQSNSVTFIPIDRKRIYDGNVSLPIDAFKELAKLRVIIFNQFDSFIPTSLECHIRPEYAIRVANNCPQLRVISFVNCDKNLQGASYSVAKCPALVYLNIVNLKWSINLNESPLISKKSILLMIQKAKLTSAITITLHPDAYARIANQPDILEALEAQPLITLVSA